MHRIDVDDAAGLFTEGNPGVGQAATKVTDDWLNDVQENLVDLVTGSGGSLVKGTYTQVRTAVSALITSAVTALKAGTNTWASLQTFSSGIAGTVATLSGALTAATAVLTSNPAVTLGLTNTLTALSIPKAMLRAAWTNGILETTGLAAEGLNVTAFSLDGSGRLVIQFANVMADDKYIVFGYANKGGGSFLMLEDVTGSKLTTSVTLKAWDTAGVASDLRTGSVFVQVLIMGRQ